nr:FAD-dependent oxidoreductase [Planctomycetota bacterium]
MSALQAPIRHQVDICFVGANSAAVAAAAAASAAGASVMVLSERPYLGEDLTATMRLRCASDDAPRTALAASLFGADGSQRPSPMQAKTIFDQHLIDANVPFLYGCYGFSLLRDHTGSAAGVVLASRSGLFAVQAKILVDATARGTLARLAGQAFTPYPSGAHVFERVVIGGEARRGAGVQVSTDQEPVAITLRDSTQHFAVQRYQLSIPMADGSIDSFAQADLRAAQMSFHYAQQSTCDALWQLPPDSIVPGAHHLDSWSDQAPLDAFRTSDQALWLLGPLADLSRAA